jgi:hypothetical protein
MLNKKIKQVEFYVGLLLLLSNATKHGVEGNRGLVTHEVFN